MFLDDAAALSFLRGMQVVKNGQPWGLDPSLGTASHFSAVAEVAASGGRITGGVLTGLCRMLQMSAAA